MNTQTQKKLNYLTETKDLIRAAIEGKGQTISDTDPFRSYADKIDAIEAGGGEEILEDIPITLDFSGGAESQTITAPDGALVKSAVIEKPDTLIPENIAKDVTIAGIIGTLTGGGGESDILLPTTELTFTADDTYGNMWLSAPALCELEIGKKYVVTWDGTDYTCEGVDLSAMMEGAVAIGNLAFVGGPDTGEPFALAYDPGTQADGVVYDSNICLTADTNTHYLKIAKAPKTLTVRTGTFRATALTQTIGGTEYTYTNPQTVNHGMGFVPDFIIVWVNKPLESFSMDLAVGYGSKMYEAFGDGKWSFVRAAFNFGGVMNVGTTSCSTGFEGTEGSQQGTIREVNTDTFKVGGDHTGSQYEYNLVTTAPYNWMAIGGITG